MTNMNSDDYGTPRAPEPGDKLHSTERLAQALLQGVNPLIPQPSLAQLVRHVREGRYHDFLSTMAFPSIALHTRLRTAGLDAVADRLLAGEFDATKAESDAWARSDEGQETFQDLVNGR